MACRDTKDHPVGDKVSLSVEKENIQIMHKEYTTNVFDGLISSNGELLIGEDDFPVDLTKLVPGSVIDEDGYVYDPKSKKRYDFKNAEVEASIALDKLTISDDLSLGHAVGRIISLVWLGDHYQYLIRTDDEEDFVVESDYSWNEQDLVSVSALPEDIGLRLKKDLDGYVAE